MYDFPHENRPRDRKWLFYQCPTRVCATAADVFWGGRGEPRRHPFGLQNLAMRLYSLGAASVPKLCAQGGATHAPRCPKSAKKESKSSLLGASSVTFGCRCEKSCPMPKHQYLLWFSHIIRVRATPFSHSKSTRARNVHLKLSLSLFSAHF